MPTSPFAFLFLIPFAIGACALPAMVIYGVAGLISKKSDPKKSTKYLASSKGAAKLFLFVCIVALLFYCLDIAYS